MRRALAATVVLSMCAAVTVSTGPAQAKHVEGTIHLSNDQPTHRLQYEPFEASNPFSPFLWPTHEECSDDGGDVVHIPVIDQALAGPGDYCHLITFEWQPDHENGHEVFLTVGWDEDECCLVIVLYNDQGHIRGQGRSDGSNPDTIEGLGGGGIADLEPGTYHLAVINDRTESGYWVEGRAEFVQIEHP